jgi:hypothetical protein
MDDRKQFTPKRRTAVVSAESATTSDSQPLGDNRNDSLQARAFTIGDEIQEQAAGTRGRQGISGPSFRDNEFQRPELPRLAVHESEDGPQANGVRRRQESQYGSLSARSPVTASESGRSDLSFRSIATVGDRGAQAYMDWEALGQGSETPGYSESLDDKVLMTEKSFGKRPLRAKKTNPPVIEDHLTSDTVCDEICRSLEISAFDGRKYLPLDRLRQILSRNVVRKLMRQNFPRRAEEFVVAVLGPAHSDGTTNHPAATRRRILAILVLIEKIYHLPDVIDKGLDDRSLPLTLTSVKKGADYTSRDESVEGHFPSWNSKTTHDFSINQHVIHAPFFKFPGEEVCCYELEHESTLPFVSDISRESGGYGSVRRVEIHPAHHNYGDGRSVSIPNIFSLIKSEY